MAGTTPVLVHNVNRAGCEFPDSVKRAAVDDNLVRNGGQLNCDYCNTPMQMASRSQRGVTPPGNDLAYDHFDPVKLGGRGGRDNVVTACRDCNGEKVTCRGLNG
jgi:5-methylcytosine-specific restriction endonuclease McrA